MPHFVTVRYSPILLDLDHTLLDTDTSLELAFDDSMRAVDADPTGCYPIFDEINRSLWLQVESHGITPDQVHQARFERLNERLGLGADPQLMAGAFAVGMGAHGDLYDGAIDALESLAAAAPLALVTNGLSQIQRARIERLDIGRYFDVITISAEVGVSKPSTDIFDLTFEALGNPPRERAVMVGDSLTSDIAGGNNAGIATCWYNPDDKPGHDVHRPTHTIASLGELVPIVTGT